MKTMAVILVASCLVGCDFFGADERRAEAQRLKQQRQEQESMAVERKSNAEALESYVANRCRMIDTKLIALTNTLTGLQLDANALENACAKVAKGVDKDGKELSYEVRVLRMLKDETVNRLALKYLSSGFVFQAEEFIAKVRDIRAAEAKYQQAVKKSEDAYDASLSASKGWVGGSKSQRDSELSRLRKEIADLERLRQATRRELVASGSQRREWQNKMADYEREIAKKRSQIDCLRNPDFNRRIEARAANERHQLQRRAADAKETELREIDYRLKPKVSVIKTAEEVNAATIGKLRAEIASRIDGLLTERTKWERKIEIAREIEVAIPVSDLGELKRLKDRVDRELSLTAAR